VVELNADACEELQTSNRMAQSRSSKEWWIRVCRCWACLSERSAGVDLDTGNVDDIRKRIGQRLLVIREDTLVWFLDLPVMFFQRELNHHRWFTKEFPSGLTIFLICI
jgi:hypothetical protein